MLNLNYQKLKKQNNAIRRLNTEKRSLKSDVTLVRLELRETIDRLNEAEATIESLTGPIDDLEELSNRWLNPWQKISLLLASGAILAALVGTEVVVTIAVACVVVPRACTGLYNYFFGGAEIVTHQTTIHQNTIGEIFVHDQPTHFKNE